MIEAGAAGVHFEDQLASEKKCGHLGGKVLVPISQHIRTLNAARLAADVEGVPTVLLCRTDAHSAQLLTTDVDERDRPFISDDRTPEGFFRIRPGSACEYAIARSLAYAPYADLLWWETSEPDLEEAERFADEIHRQFPGKMLAYNCSPSFNWKKKLARSKHRRVPARHRRDGLPVPVRHAGRLPQPEPVDVQPGAGLSGARHGGLFRVAAGRVRRARPTGYTATRHQREVGVGYFDAVAMAISGGKSSTTALSGSTEAAQFHDAPATPMCIRTTMKGSCTTTSGRSRRNRAAPKPGCVIAPRYPGYRGARRPLYS